MSMMANRFRGIRAAVCTNEFLAVASRRHNNANVLCLGERVVGAGLACAVVDAFLRNEFEGGRHQERIAMFDCNPDA
jgi:ribose 5-phosphate isomerase B